MEGDPEQQVPPSNNQENSPPPEQDVDVTSLLEKMQRDIAKVSENTTSEKNQNALDRIEKALEKVIGAIGTILPGKQEENPVTPQTPNVEVPGMKWIAVRKRGGRVVKRAVPTEEKKE